MLPKNAGLEYWVKVVIQLYAG